MMAPSLPAYSLACVVDPQGQGLTPYPVAFQRPQSALVPSMRDEGMRYTHPAREECALVWAQSEATIAEVLTYHYQQDWSNMRILTLNKP